MFVVGADWHLKHLIRISAGNRAEKIPLLSLLTDISRVCFKWKQLLAFSSSLIRDACADAEETVTGCVAAHGLSPHSLSARKLFFLPLLSALEWGGVNMQQPNEQILNVIITCHEQ